MGKTERKNAKPMILSAALDIFSDKGFDGARIDEIAVHAGVPKSLIYYHFEGKAQLLEELIKGYYQRYEELLASTLGDDEKIEMGSRAFARDNEKLIRVVLTESLKGNTKLPSLFAFVEGLIERERNLLGRNSENLSKRMLAEFFLNVMPRAMFACYRNAWGEHFGAAPETVEKEFYEVMVEMHGAYLARLF